MSTSYNTYYGIGYEVCEGSELTEEELEDGLEEYIDAECSEDFEVFSINSGYDTEIQGIYLVIKDPFKYGLDLSKVKEQLDNEIIRLSLEAVEDFGVVGGMYVC